MTKTLDQLAASTTTADADLLLKRDDASGDDKKIREDDLQLSRSAVRQINVGGAADYTLTNGDAGRTLIEFIGVLTGNIDVIVPTSGRRYTFVNSTSGSFTITVKTSAGTGVLMPQGELRQVRCDGTNVITGDGFSDFTSMPKVNGDPIVESGSNSDGEWTRWADGSQNVRGLDSTGTTTSDSTNFLSATPVQSRVFPSAFIANPTVKGACLQSSGFAMTSLLVSDATLTTTGFDGRGFSDRSTGAVFYGYEATGLWK